MNSATPLWQSIIAGFLLCTLIAFTFLTWYYVAREKVRRSEKKTSSFLLLGLGIVTLHLVLGALLFALPFLFFPYHDQVGVGWFKASPLMALLAIGSGWLARLEHGKPLSIAGLAGLSLWILVASTVTI